MMRRRPDGIFPPPKSGLLKMMRRMPDGIFPPKKGGLLKMMRRRPDGTFPSKKGGLLKMIRRRPDGTFPSKKGGLLKWVAVCAAALCLGVLAASVAQIVSIQAQRSAAGKEYDALRQRYAPQSAGAAAGTPAPAASESEAPKPPAEVNPDYVGWLAIPGAGVDYPVVRGADNEKYLHTTFEGAANSAGAIFMDCGNTGGFGSRHAILYGHNVRNGSMFGTLKKYLDAGYLAKNPSITVTLPNGDAVAYRIFAARLTDAWDAAYQLSFADDNAFAAFATGLGAPQGAVSLLTLSTCTDGANADERVLVHAVR